MDWLVAFILTVALETPVLFVVVGRGGHWAFAAGFLANLTSHPVLWFLLPSVIPAGHYIIFGELAVVIIEYSILAVMLKGCGKVGLFCAALLMNAVSYIVGENLYLLLGG